MTPLTLLSVARMARRSAPSAGTATRRTANAPTIRTANPDDAPAIDQLIASHHAEGRLLLRQRDEIAAHAHRFVVADRDGEVVACAELAPLSRRVAEVRSLVVRGDARGGNVGCRLVEELMRQGSAAGFESVCAFTHTPGYFVRLGFSIVPHAWVPEKVATDCLRCDQFRSCGQHAVRYALARPGSPSAAPMALHV